MTKLIAMGSGGMKPSTPVIGTATDTALGGSVSVAFTPSTYIGKGTITYTATSTPGSITGSSATSPITVSGLTNGTSYTFTVVGTTNYGVSSDSTAASNSATPSAPNPAWDSIASITTTVTNSFIFSSIPQTYKHLAIMMVARSNDAAITSVDYSNIRFNGDSASNYGSGQGITYTEASSTPSIQGATTSVTGGRIQFAVAPNASVYAYSMMYILDYATTVTRKQVLYRAGEDQASTNANSGGIFGAATMTTKTDAVTSIQFLYNSNATSGLYITLFGIKG